MLNPCLIGGANISLHSPNMPSALGIRPSLYSGGARNACWISSLFLENPTMTAPDEQSSTENNILLSDNDFSDDDTSETGLWPEKTDIKRFSNLSRWQRWKWYSILAVLLTISTGLNIVLMMSQIGLSSSAKLSTTYNGGNSQYCEF